MTSNITFLTAVKLAYAYSIQLSRTIMCPIESNALFLANKIKLVLGLLFTKQASQS